MAGVRKAEVVNPETNERRVSIVILNHYSVTIGGPYLTALEATRNITIMRRVIG
jgi:hypothetical protein